MNIKKLTLLLTEATGKLSDLDFSKEGFLPMTMEDFFKEYNIPSNITLTDLKRKYREALDDFTEVINNKIADTGFDLDNEPKSGYSWRIRVGKVFRGPNREPYYNKTGETPWSFEVLFGGQPYNQFKTVEELVDFFAARADKTFTENYVSDELNDKIELCNNLLRYLATNLDIPKQDGYILLRASDVLENLEDNEHQVDNILNDEELNDVIGKELDDLMREKK